MKKQNVPPAPVKLGDTCIYVTVKGVLEKRDITGHIVPFKKSLSNLVQIPEVWHYINNPQASTTQYMYDVLDGDVIRTDPFFIRNMKALQITLSTAADDIEIVNPLGSTLKYIN